MREQRRPIRCPKCRTQALYSGGGIYLCGGGHEIDTVTPGGPHVYRVGGPPQVRRPIRCPRCDRRARWTGAMYRCGAGHEIDRL